VSLAAVAEHGLPEAAPGLGLGFLRLAILDLSLAGEQPMVEGVRAAVVLNGEIYNFVELREELRARGWTFRSTGDTEVLLKGWLEWGDGVFARLDGMFAVAIYDSGRHGLLLARDRFGEKPLHWTAWRGGIAFASEVKQLAAFPDVRLALNLDRAGAFIASGRPYEGQSTWFQGIQQVPPGGTLWIDAAGLREARYFDLRAAVRAIDAAPTPGEWGERFATGFERSTRRRLRSDVPVGTSLSSGLDSSAIATQVTALGRSAYHTFTLTSDDPQLDEGRRAASLASRLGARWHAVHADGTEFAGLWDRLTWHQETPVASISLYGQWKIAEAARAEGVIVMLDGQGADEVLGGYHKFGVAHLVDTLRHRPWLAPGVAIGFARQVGGPGAILANGYRYLGRLGGMPDVSSLLGSGRQHQAVPRVTVDPLAMRLADIERWSLPNLLSFLDRNAMAHSVETRLPFLDHELVALVLAMPSDVLIHGGWTKWPVRRMLAAAGEGSVAWRRGKVWFDVPQAAWLRGPLANHVVELARDPHPLWDDLAAPGGLDRFHDAWSRRDAGPAWDATMFTLVALDRFLRVWFPDAGA
jgi:asparagine synthase (glutamine-hydrolysing)